jgi:hypothetical protein
VGTTAAVAIAGGITAGLANRSWDKLQSDNWTSRDQWENERDRYDRLQLSSRITLGITAGLIVADIVLLYFTYLRNQSEQKAVAISITPNSGLLVLTREF